MHNLRPGKAEKPIKRAMGNEDYYNGPSPSSD